MSAPRRSDYDVTNTVRISHPQDVCAAVCAILAARFPKLDPAPLRQAFQTFAQLYAGTLPGYVGNDTWYHDAQHSLDCALAMARLIDGHDSAMPAARRLGARRAQLGVIAALFHDAGYVRKRSDPERNGAAFTLTHVGRSGEFLTEYLPTIGFGDEAAMTRQLVHFTGYEIALDAIQVHEARDRMLGFLLGTADILAQMSDRCYPEKCHTYLFHEFRVCGLAAPGVPGGPAPIYQSPEDLILKTPAFTGKLFKERLDGYFDRSYRFFQPHFGGADPYLQEVRQHLAYVDALISSGSMAGLRRLPQIVNAPALSRLWRNAPATSEPPPQRL